MRKQFLSAKVQKIFDISIIFLHFFCVFRIIFVILRVFFDIRTKKVCKLLKQRKSCAAK